jgi:arylsulfatase A-like enzyme
MGSKDVHTPHLDALAERSLVFKRGYLNPPERLFEKYNTKGKPTDQAMYFAMCEWFDETCGELLGYLDKQGLTDNP